MHGRARFCGGMVVAALAAGLIAMGASGCSENQTQPAAPSAKVVNATCPIMGTTLDPANVPAGLTRVHEGQKVGFCCAECLAAWDKLTDAGKTAKLKGESPKGG